MKIAAILGGAASVWKDWNDLKNISEVDEIIAVNTVGIRFYGEINHWVTLHPELMQDWLAVRAGRGLNPPGCIWFPAEASRPRIPHKTNEDWGGSGGLFAVKVALDLGFDKIVLCGVPTEASAGHIEYGGEWVGDNVRRYQAAWQRHLPDMESKVRSMSGWTAQLLGSPDEFWI